MPTPSVCSGFPGAAALPALTLAVLGLASSPTPSRAEPGPPPRTLPAERAEGTSSPSAPKDGLALHELSLSGDAERYTSFGGSPALSFEALAVIGSDEGFAFRPMVQTRLGPLSLGLGALIGKEVRFNAHLDVFSYQSNGWDFGVGAGITEYVTVRFAIPLIEGLRVRAMGGYGALGGFGGLGLETAPW